MNWSPRVIRKDKGPGAALILFGRLVLRPLIADPLRTVLAVLAVALGVAVVIAIDLAGQSAAGSFHSALDSLGGTSDWSIRATGGVPTDLLGRLSRLPYPLTFIGRIEDFAFVNGRGEAIPFLGLDLIGGANVLQADSRIADDTKQTIGQPGDNSIWVSSSTGLRVHQTVNLLINDRLQKFTVKGLIPSQPSNGGGIQIRSKLIVSDIGLAERVTGKVGKLDSIDVAGPTNERDTDWTARLQRYLPPGVFMQPRGARTAENRKMLSAFRWNLQVLSYIALLVGGFLIYNTISVSVVRRRPTIGVLRALGMTRSAVLIGVLSEAATFACAGCLLGIMVGRILATAAVQLVGSTVQSLYVTSEAAALHLNLGSVLNGLLTGILVSVAAAFLPARDAASTTPIEALARGRREWIVGIHSNRTLVFAATSLVLAALFSTFPAVNGRPLFAYAAVLLLVAGAAAAIPALVHFFANRSFRLLESLGGVEALLALRFLRASPGRSSILIAALAVAVAMTTAVGIMVGSFRETVTVWMNNELKADFYLRPAGEAAADRHPTFDATLADRIAALPGVLAVDRFRAYPITYDGLPATLAGGEDSRVESSPSTRFLPGEDRSAILSKLPTGNFAIVSEPFANKHNVQPGSILHLPIGRGDQPFTVLGVYYDYSTERGFIVLDRRTLLRYLPDPALSNLAVFLEKGAQPQAVRRGIAGVLSGRAVLLFSNAELRHGAIEIFDRTFRITYALEAVAVFVAVMGIAFSLLAWVLDRKREFALLQFLGGAKPQLRRIVLFEAGLFGLLSNGIGLALGTLLSLILVFVINKQSFGWTIQFHWPASLLLAALSGIYLATIAAGLYPASAAVKLNPIEVIHEE